MDFISQIAYDPLSSLDVAVTAVTLVLSGYVNFVLSPSLLWFDKHIIQIFILPAATFNVKGILLGRIFLCFGSSS